MAAARRCSGEFFANAPLPQFSEPHLSPLPLLPDHRPQPAPDPAFKFIQHRGRLAVAEISNPASEIAAQLLGHSLHFYASRPPRQFPNLLFESEHRLRRDSPFWFPIRREAKPQKLPFPGPGHRTLLLVHLELELRRDESCDALHHSFSCPSASDVHITVVRVPHKPETSPLQLPVELVEHDVTEQWRQWSALRRPFVYRTHQPAFHHTGSPKCADQL